MIGRGGIGSKLAPARFLVFLALLIAAFAGYRAILPNADWRDAAVQAFAIAAAIFLVSLVPLLRGTSAEAMRIHAARNDANRPMVLGLTSLLTLVVMAAIAGEMPGARAGDPFAIAKLVGTLLLIWLFANSVYALHYAHAYYLRDDRGHDCAGLTFPATSSPDYADFAYFAFTLGMTFQTSDVQISARPIRRVALLHTMAAFLFNIGVIAFTVNGLSGAS